MGFNAHVRAHIHQQGLRERLIQKGKGKHSCCERCCESAAAAVGKGKRVHATPTPQKPVWKRKHACPVRYKKRKHRQNRSLEGGGGTDCCRGQSSGSSKNS
ncbi:unnamed protein product [Ectocarpus sp. 12 AP-2014]